MATGTAPDQGGHFLGQVVHMVTRLRDHIERLDGGAVYAADDLAGVLRTLVCPGTGNDVLARMQATVGHTARSIMVSRAPDLAARFAVGSIPTREHTERDGAKRLTIAQWVESPVVHVQDKGGTTTYSWAGFLNAYANKWGGAHLDRSIPMHLRAIDMYSAGSLNLSGYLLRTAAVVVWRAAQEVLGAYLPPSGSLTPEDQANRVLVAPSGIGSHPADRLSHGELQWLTYTGDLTMFLMYASGPCRLSIAGGGSQVIELDLRPMGSMDESNPLNRVRAPAEPTLDPDRFVGGRRMAVGGVILRPPGPHT